MIFTIRHSANKILLSLLFVLICSNSAKSDATNLINEKIACNSNKSDDAVAFMKDFFKWYKTQSEYLNKIHVVNMNFKTNAPYRINFQETERYLSILKLSGYFSENYISYYRDYFKKIDLTLQKTKQNDGTVDGLDFDFILHSQEPESYLKNLDVIQLSVVNSSVSKVIIKMKTKLDPAYALELFYLTKVNGKYLIDKINAG